MKKILIEKINEQSYPIDNILDTMDSVLSSGGNVMDFVCALTGLHKDTLSDVIPGGETPEGQGTDAWAYEAAKKITAGETVRINGCNLLRASKYAEAVSKCLTVNGFNIRLRILTYTREGLLIPCGITGEYSYSIFDIFSDIQKLNAGEKVVYRYAEYSTVTHYIAKLNRHVIFAGLGWRAKLNIYEESGSTLYEIVSSEKKRRPNKKISRWKGKKLHFITRELMAQGTVHLNGYSKSSLERYKRNINKEFLSEGFAGKAVIITDGKESGEKNYGLTIDYEGKPDENSAAEHKRNRKREMSFIASEITKNGRYPAGESSSVANYKTGSLNRYLLEKDADWKAKCIKEGESYVIIKKEKRKAPAQSRKESTKKLILEKLPDIIAAIEVNGEYRISEKYTVYNSYYVNYINKYLADQKKEWRVAYVKKEEGEKQIHILVNKASPEAANAKGLVSERVPAIAAFILANGEYILEESGQRSADYYVKQINRYLEKEKRGWRVKYVARTEGEQQVYAIIGEKKQ